MQHEDSVFQSLEEDSTDLKGSSSSCGLFGSRSLRNAPLVGIDRSRCSASNNQADGALHLRTNEKKLPALKPLSLLLESLEHGAVSFWANT